MAKLAQAERMPMSSTQSELNALRERVRALEHVQSRTRRGRINQRKAAEYLGRSREFLRTLHLRGAGPRRGADGSYSYDDLDLFAEQNPTNPTACDPAGCSPTTTNAPGSRPSSD